MAETKHVGSNSAPLWGTAVVLLYLLFPHAFVLPFKAAEALKIPPKQLEPVMYGFFLPIRLLGDKFPAYRALLDKESDLTGIR